MKSEWLECIECHKTYKIDEIRYTCDCHGLLVIERPKDWSKKLTPAICDERFGSRKALDRSGVWRFREGVFHLSEDEVITHPEGCTRLYERHSLSEWCGAKHIFFKHEGENPTGSFKDRGMTVAVSQAKRLGLNIVACASTGNTSASLAAYAGQAGLNAVVFIPSGKIAMGKLAQALGYGAHCLAIKGDFDAAMELVKDAAIQFGIYLVNSLNPFRLEGQKTIIWEILQDLRWKAPDWIVVPAGNLGNTSAFGKALKEAKQAGWIQKIPKIASIQAEGANPFFQSFQTQFKKRFRVNAETIATAIRIGNPVNFDKAKRSIEDTGGLVSQVSDSEIICAKKQIDKAGIGCEPASAATLAGVKKLIHDQLILKDDQIVCILTGHILKDPDAILKNNAHIQEIEPDLKIVESLLNRIRNQ